MISLKFEELLNSAINRSNLKVFIKKIKPFLFFYYHKFDGVKKIILGPSKLKFSQKKSKNKLISLYQWSVIPFQNKIK